MAPSLSYNKQEELFKPLNELNTTTKIIGDGNYHYLVCGDKKRLIYAYPAMWNKRYYEIPDGALPISDKMLKEALPKVDAMIREAIT